MLTQVVLQRSPAVAFDIGATAEGSRLILKSITGLDPVDASLFVGEYAGDGGYYQGRRVSKRNPVFTFMICPDYENDIPASQIREDLYRWFFNPGGNQDGLQVHLIDDSAEERYFVAYTEKIDYDLWAKAGYIQVSTIAPDPYLKSATPVVESNPAGWTSLPLTYNGTAETGFQVSISVRAATPSITLSLNGETMTINGPFVNGDTVGISTVRGARSITKNGSDFLVGLTASSKWLTLRQESNTLSVYGTVVGDGKASILSYQYRASWWGI